VGRNLQRQSMRIHLMISYYISLYLTIRNTYLEAFRVILDAEGIFVGVKTFELDDNPR
jgi:hypothetical protein